MKELYLDTETYCETPIKWGISRYAENVEVTVFAFARDDESVTVLDMTAGDTIPEDVAQAMTDAAVVKVMHNSYFDRHVIASALKIDIPVEQIHDTMIQAMAHSLPGGLGNLCDIYGLSDEEAKDKEGRSLINMFCKPRPKNMKLRRATRETHPKEWAKFLKYAGSDITAMRVLKKKLPMWNYHRRDDVNFLRQGCDRSLWELDQKINDRGITVDTELADAAIKAIDTAQKSMSARTNEISYGDVTRTTQRDKLLKHILDYYGVGLPDLQKDTLERRLNDSSLPLPVRELIAIRLEASMASTGKYKKLLECVSPDGRLRGTLQYDGAARTRRWAGRMFQPQNLPRPSHKQKEIDEGIKAIKAGYIDMVEENVISLASSCIRGVLLPAEGKKLVVSDLANIEGRAAAFLAGEDWKLDAFRAFDNGTGPDLYKVAYARAFNVPVEEAVGDKRQIGKVMELMLQYEGGVGAFLTGAATYGIDLDAMAAAAWPQIPAHIKQLADEMYTWTVDKGRSTFGLSPEAYKTCEALKRMWREAHPAISSYWRELKDCAFRAIRTKKPVKCRKVTMELKGSWLKVTMPSGHSLCYASPVIEKEILTFMGMSPYSRQWKRQKTYGGKLFENLCQSLSRDVLGFNMPLVESEGYDILLTVHDELITEAPDTRDFNSEHLSTLMSNAPAWAEGFPLAAGGFEAKRYRKG